MLFMFSVLKTKFIIDKFIMSYMSLFLDNSLSLTCLRF